MKARATSLGFGRGWTVDGELVWGATAAIVRGFVGILRELALDQ